MSRPGRAEEALVAHLTTAVGVETSTDVPLERPNLFVQVTQAGGPRLNVGMAQTRVVVRVWGSDAVDPSDLTDEVWSALDVGHNSQIGGMWVSNVDLTIPANDPDPKTGSPRYTFVATLTAPLED